MWDTSDVNHDTGPRLPQELLEHIASFSDTETHAVLGEVCRAFVDLSRRRVFQHLTANRMESLRISHLVNELANIVESTLCTISPHVRYLTLQLQLPYRGGLPDGVLRRLPNLTSLTVEGTEDEPCILPDLQPISCGILPLAALTLKYANVVSFSIIAHALVALPRLQSLCLYEISDQDTDGSADELIPNPPEGTLAQLQSLDCIMERYAGARLLRRFLTWVLALPATPPIRALNIRRLGAQPDVLLLVRDLVQRLQPTLTEWRIDPDEGDYFLRIERESRASRLLPNRPGREGAKTEGEGNKGKGDGRRVTIRTGPVNLKHPTNSTLTCLGRLDEYTYKQTVRCARTPRAINSRAKRSLRACLRLRRDALCWGFASASSA